MGDIHYVYLLIVWVLQGLPTHGFGNNLAHCLIFEQSSFHHTDFSDAYQAELAVAEASRVEGPVGGQAAVFAERIRPSKEVLCRV